MNKKEKGFWHKFFLTSWIFDYLLYRKIMRTDTGKKISK